MTRAAAPRRVVYVLDHYVVLSETFVREEIRELRRRGWTVDVVALAEGDLAPEPDEPVRYLDAAWPRGGLRRQLVHGLRHAAATVSISARMRAFRRAARSLPGEGTPWRRLPTVAAGLRGPDLVWVHAHFGWRAAAVAAGLAPLLDVPWSMTLHARDIFAEPRNLDAKLGLVHHLVTVCDYNRRWLEEHHGPLPPTTIAVCGVDVPATPVLAGDADTDVVAIARLVEKKGLDLLVEACADLRHRHPHLRVEIIGDGPERDRLAGAIHRAGLDRHVRLAGAMAHAQALARLERARVTCLPARIAADGDRDSMPVVLKEAMARAIPVVATDIVAIPEMVDEQVGRLVPPENASALAAAIDELLTDAGLRRRLGTAGRARVNEQFTVQHQVDALVSVFESTAAR